MCFLILSLQVVPLCGLDSLQTANILKRAHNEDGMRITRALNAEGYIFVMSFRCVSISRGEFRGIAN